jgi:hypothetical protein
MRRRYKMDILVIGVADDIASRTKDFPEANTFEMDDNSRVRHLLIRQGIQRGWRTLRPHQPHGAFAHLRSETLLAWEAAMDRYEVEPALCSAIDVVNIRELRAVAPGRPGKRWALPCRQDRV